MKKIISLLLVVAMSVSLVACGSKAHTDNNEPQTSESGSQQETENNQSENNAKSETVELTMDNWQDYFEIKPYAEVGTNTFDEIEYIFTGCGLVIKDEYAKNWSVSDGAVEWLGTGEHYAPFEYNSETKELKIGEPYTEEELLEINSFFPRQDLSEDGSCSLDSLRYEENGCFPINNGVAGAAIVEINGDIVTAAGRFYDTVEITRIKGTLSFEK